jgi:hypothetical protein
MHDFTRKSANTRSVRDTEFLPSGVSDRPSVSRQIIQVTPGGWVPQIPDVLVQQSRVLILWGPVDVRPLLIPDEPECFRDPFV